MPKIYFKIYHLSEIICRLPCNSVNQDQTVSEESGWLIRIFTVIQAIYATGMLHN